MLFLASFYPSKRVPVGNKMSPRPSLIPDAAEVQQFLVSSPETIERDTESSSNHNLEKNEPNKTANRASSCRVCLKSFKPDDFSKTCYECKFRVCEDCASYSKVDSAEDLVSSNCNAAGMLIKVKKSRLIRRILGDVVYVEEKCLRVFASRKTRQIQTWTCQCSKLCKEGTRTQN